MGSKVAITSDTPQTTRHRLRAVVNRADAQMVIVDTPGLHKPHDALGEELNRSALKALEDTDVVAMLIDATARVGGGDEWVAEHIAKARRAKKILVLTKADIASAEQVDRQLRDARALLEFDDVVVLSAKEEFNLEGFYEAVLRFLPEGPRWFPADMPTDQPIEVMIAEFVREKILRTTHDEVPHAVGVQVEQMSYNKKNDTTSIWAVIYVERDSQKGIIIGKGGESIKRIGSRAREDLERLLGTKVFLELTVKVKKDWRRDASQIRRFGYGERL
jgi:GTP-binding protein Era